LVQYTVFWLNNIPKKGQTQSPKEIIMGEQKLMLNLFVNYHLERTFRHMKIEILQILCYLEQLEQLT
jgi:hypothetical protein